MRCTECGRKLPEKTPFCPYCGAQLGKAKSRISPAALFIGIGAALVFVGMAAIIGLLLVKGGGATSSVSAREAKELILRSDVIFAYPGDGVKLTYDVVPNGAEEGEVKWSVSDESVAQVDGAGMVTFIKEGEVTVTAALENGVTGTKDLICGKRPYKLTFAEEEILLELGESKTVTPVIMPADAVYNAIEWTSSDERIVRVEEDGSLAAVAQGTAYVTASVAGVKNRIDVFVYKYKFDLLMHRLMTKGGYDEYYDEYYFTLDEFMHSESGGRSIYGETLLSYVPNDTYISLYTYMWDTDDTVYYVLNVYFERGKTEEAEFRFYCYCDPDSGGASFHVPLSEVEPIEVDAGGMIDVAEYRIGDPIEFIEYSGRDDFKDTALEYAQQMLTSAMRAMKTKWSSFGVNCTSEEAFGLKKY